MKRESTYSVRVSSLLHGVNVTRAVISDNLKVWPLPPSVRARLRLPSISPPSPSRRNYPNLNFIMAECKVWSGRAGEAVVQHHISKSFLLLPSDTKTAQEQLSTKAKLREERGVRAGWSEGGREDARAGVNANLNDAKTCSSCGCVSWGRHLKIESTVKYSTECPPCMEKKSFI